MKNISLRRLTQTALFVCVLAASSFVSIPFAVPFTLQTLAIGFCLSALGTVHTLKILAVYTLIGFCGVPVFSGFRAGIAALAEPSGGFIVGFFFMAIAFGLLKKILPSSKIKIYVCLVLSLLVLYLFGSLWYAFLYIDLSFMGIASAFAATSAPYALPDAVKVIMGAVCAKKTEKYLKTYNK